MQRDPVSELKEQLRVELVRIIDGHRAWDVAVQMGTDPPRVSDLRRGKLRRLSLESLVRFLWRLGRRVELRIVHTRAD